MLQLAVFFAMTKFSSAHFKLYLHSRYDPFSRAGSLWPDVQHLFAYPKEKAEYAKADYALVAGYMKVRDLLPCIQYGLRLDPAG